MVLLDTHIWIWLVGNLPQLSKKENVELNTLTNRSQLVLSIISVWEVEILQRKGRIQLGMDIKRWIALATSPTHIRVLPIDERVILAQRALPNTFHSDPADRLITATALLSGYELATKDQKIVDAGVCMIWKP